MKKQHWIFFLVFIVVLGFGIASAISFRAGLQSFTPSDENVAQLPINLGPDFSEQNQGFTEITGAELVDRAELAVIVKPTGTRRSTPYATLSEVKVEQVLKENGTVAVGDTIFVYEAALIEPDGANSYGLIQLEGFHTLMKPDRSYVVLLNFYQRPEGWNYSEENLKTYLMIDAYYGQFPIEEPQFLIYHEAEYYPMMRELQGKGQPMLYAEIADYDCAYVILESDTPEGNMFRLTYTRLREELLQLAKTENVP